MSNKKWQNARFFQRFIWANRIQYSWKVNIFKDNSQSLCLMTCNDTTTKGPGGSGKCCKVHLQEDQACKHMTGVGGWCVMERLSITEVGMTNSHEDQTPTVVTNRPTLKGHHVNQTKSEGHKRRALWVCDPRQNSADFEHN